jgi:hypothetical protein
MSKHALLTLTGALIVIAGCAKKSPLVPATPWADVLDDALCFLTASTDPSGLKVQYVFDWGNGDTTTTSLYKSGDTACCPRSFPDTGAFHIKVKARNEQGRASKWSDECLFHASTPPQLVDTIVGLPRWAVDRWYRPSVKVMDPDGDSVSVKFIWSDSLTSGWSPFVASGSTVTDSVKWQTTGRHVVHVLLKDKGSMVNSSAGAKIVNVSQVAVLWYTSDSMDLGSYASPTMGEIDGEPVLYVASDPLVFCLGLDGSIKWTTDVGRGWDFAPSLSNDGIRLYLADIYEGLFCLDARTGSVLWSADVFGCYGTLAVGPDGALYVTTTDLTDDTALVLKLQDCGDSAHIQWRVPFSLVPSEPGWGVVVGANGTIYAGCTKGYTSRTAIMALDTNGAVLWQDTTHIEGSSWLYAPVTDSRGRAIIADNDGNLLCFNQDGTLAWSASVSVLMYQGGVTVGYDDRVYFQSDDGRLYCYDSEGHWVWAADIPYGDASMSSPCALSDSTVLTYCSEADELTCFSWDGDVLWTFSIEDSIEETRRTRARRDEGDDDTTPLVGPDGNVYLAGDYSVYCVAIGNVRLANTAWPTYNHDNARSGWAGRPQR